MKLLKNKKGFSLVELMVVVAIMGTLASIAIPAFNEYRKSAKKNAYRADLSTLHKGWLAFGVELDSFCERETEPDEASIKNVGMESIFSSKFYGANPGKKNFIGFGAMGSSDCGTWAAATHIQSANTSNDTALAISDASGTTDAHCALDVDSYKMGVFGHISGTDYISYQIQDTGVIAERAAGAASTVLPTTCS